MSKGLSEEMFGFPVHAEEVLFAALKDRKKAKETLREMLAPFAGAVLRLPSMKALSLKDRDAWIRANFDGENYERLAAATGLRVRQVRRIVHENA